MKATVIEVFQDKITGEHYAPGRIIDISDKNRLDDMVKRNLVKVAVEKVAEEPRRTATRKGR